MGRIQHVILVGISILAASVQAEKVGSIKGQVKFEGDVSRPDAYRIGGDRYCEELASRNPIYPEEVLVNTNETLKNVVVWVDSGWLDGGKPKVNFGGNASVVQEGCKFYPHVIAVQAGQEILVENKDNTLHNLNALPQNNPRQNYVMLAENIKPVTLKFDKPEVAIRLKDDIHPWMTAWVAVFDHPNFDMTGDDGRFEIKNLEPGEYTVKAWHEKYGVVSTTVLVKKEVPTEVTFEFTSTGTKSGAKAESGDIATTASTPKWE